MKISGWAFDKGLLLSIVSPKQSPADTRHSDLEVVNKDIFICEVLLNMPKGVLTACVQPLILRSCGKAGKGKGYPKLEEKKSIEASGEARIPESDARGLSYNCNTARPAQKRQAQAPATNACI